MSYESVRAHLSHTILGNGFFSYLSEPPSYWKNRKLPIEVRAEELSSRWKEVFARPNSIRHAYQTWLGPPANEKSISEVTWEFYELTQRHPAVSPTDEFPSRHTVTLWLTGVDGLMTSLASAAFSYQPEQVKQAREFWTCGLTLYGFLQDTKFGSERFWCYFKGK